MYALHVESSAALDEQTRLFEQYIEPLLVQLEQAYRSGVVPAELPEIAQYLQVCRWPFRKLEYSFALDALLEHLQPGARYLDAGSGVTPLAHAIASQGVQADACDGEKRLITELRQFAPERIYGNSVTYAAQDLTALTYDDNSFDAISCISVLEHIPAPADQQAVRELMRVLKPGGLLVLTVDFTPPVAHRDGHIRHYAGRVVDLIRKGDVKEIGRGVMRKVQAHRVAAAGGAQVPRSANQCFEIAHLEQDILPCLDARPISSTVPFAKDLRAVTPQHARFLWDLEAGLYNNQGRRSVLPAAFVTRKAAGAKAH